MKKLLLLSAVALLCGSAQAKTDGQTYEPVNGIKIANQWVLDRQHKTNFTSMEACNARARTAVMTEDIIYVARSEAKSIVNGNDTISASVIYRFKTEDGTPLPELDVTLDGSPYGAFLGVNQIGVDNFGHLWVMPYTSEAEASTSVPLYALDKETGALTLIARLPKGDVIQRTDYYDVLGDITREEAECNVMSAAANSAIVYRWHADQGDEFEGGFEGDTYLEILDFYPETVTQWALGPTVKMCYDPEAESPYAGELFYVDGFNSAPILYDVTGTMYDNFEDVDPDLLPWEIGANGCAEFTLEGRNFFVYAMAQYSGLDEKTNNYRACQINICELGEGMEIAGMSQYWMVPYDGLGDTSDGGNRVHCINTLYSQENGKDVVTLFTFKSYNGMAVYKIGTDVTGPDPDPEVYGDVDGNGIVDTADLAIVIDAILGLSDNTAADVDGNGIIDTTDMALVIDIILGL